jgi:hypothetical protein
VQSELVEQVHYLLCRRICEAVQQEMSNNDYEEGPGGNGTPAELAHDTIKHSG